MSRLILCFSLLLFPIHGAFANSAQLSCNPHELKEELGNFESHHTKQEMTALAATFEKAVDCILEISKSQLSENEKKKLSFDIIDAGGKAFGKLTSPYANPYQYKKPKWGGTWDNILLYGEAAFLSIGRDFQSIPLTAPFHGDDYYRSKAIKRISKKLQKAYKTETDLENIQKWDAMVNSFSEAEPVRYGRHHQFVMWTYRTIGLYFFLFPPLELVIERSTYSPIVSGVVYASVLYALSWVRKTNSGLDFYFAVKKLEKLKNKVSNKCQSLLTKD